MTVTLGGDTAVPAPGSGLGPLTVLLAEPHAQGPGGQSKPKGNLASGGGRKHSREQFKWAFHYSGVVGLWVVLIEFQSQEMMTCSGSHRC